MHFSVAGIILLWHHLGSLVCLASKLPPGVARKIGAHPGFTPIGCQDAHEDVYSEVRRAANAHNLEVAGVPQKLGGWTVLKNREG